MLQPIEKKKFAWMFGCFSKKSSAAIKEVTSNRFDPPRQSTKPLLIQNDVRSDFGHNASVTDRHHADLDIECLQHLSTIVNYDHTSTTFTETSESEMIADDDDDILLPDVKCYHLPFNNYVGNNVSNSNELMIGQQRSRRDNKKQLGRRSQDDSFLLGEDVLNVAFSFRRNLQDIGESRHRLGFSGQKNLPCNSESNELRRVKKETATVDVCSYQTRRKEDSVPAFPSSVNPTAIASDFQIGICNEENRDSTIVGHRRKVKSTSSSEPSADGDGGGQGGVTRPFRGVELVSWIRQRTGNTMENEEALLCAQNLLTSGCISSADPARFGAPRFDECNYYVLGRNY